MYKVFIQNKPVIFVSTDEITHFEGFYIHEEQAIVHKETILSLVNDLPNGLNIIVICQKPVEALVRFFNNYEKVEAAGGLVQKGEHFLLIFRNEKWDLPKGMIEPGEKPDMAARREVEEECGVGHFTACEPLTKTFHVYDYEGTPTIKKTYWFALETEDERSPVPQQEEGITEVRWCTREEIQELKPLMYPSLLDVVGTL